MFNCDLIGTCTDQGMTAELACANTGGKVCGDASLNKKCLATECCDTTTPTMPVCRPANAPCGTTGTQYCSAAASYTCQANKQCGATASCNPPSCCDTAVTPNVCGSTCSNNATCNTSTGLCTTTPGKQCGTRTCNPGECCDNNTTCIPSGSACPSQGGTCSNGVCTSGGCTEGTYDSCKSEHQHCVNGTCTSCSTTSPTARNCDRNDNNDCECPNGCNPSSPSTCATAGTTTKCPEYATTGFVTCTTATQICVIYSDTGGEGYECKNVPSGCDLTRTCQCLQGVMGAQAPCYGWPVCDDTTTLTNTITCQE